MPALNRLRRRRYAALAKATLLIATAAVLLTPKVDLSIPSFSLVTAAHAAPADVP